VRLKHLGANQDDGRAPTESGLQAHPLIFYKLRKLNETHDRFSRQLEGISSISRHRTWDGSFAAYMINLVLYWALLFGCLRLIASASKKSCPAGHVR
jgi:hypothetical protein